MFLKTAETFCIEDICIKHNFPYRLQNKSQNFQQGYECFGFHLLENVKMYLF